MKPLYPIASAAILILAFTAFPEPAAAQIQLPVRGAVDEADPAFPALIEQKNAIRDSYEEEGYSIPDFGPWIRIESPEAEKLFPDLSFYSIRWNEQAHPDAPDAGGRVLVSRAGGLKKVVALDRETNKPADGYRGFWKALADRKVTIKSEEDAQRIWKANCTIERQGSWTSPCEEVKAGEWHLGISSYDQTVASDAEFKTVVTRTHYQKLVVDRETGIVLSAEPVVDTSAKRLVPVGEPG